MNSISPLKTLPFIFGAASAWLLLASCNSRGSWVILPNLSPPVATVVGKPMEHAEALAKHIPNSYVMVAHSTVRFAIYPHGTVLIIQKIDWRHLRSGMTAVYYIDEGVTAALKGGILTHKENNIWRVPEIEAWHPARTGSHEKVDLVTQTRYEGVVVAAFLEKDHYDPQVMLRYAPAEVAGSCVLRCHAPGPR